MNSRAASQRCTMASATDCEDAVVKAHPLVRREARVGVSLALQVSGFDRNGRFFTERTSTSDFSENGCSFRLNVLTAPNAILALVPVGDTAESARPVFYRVIWTKELSSGVAVGATRVAGENAWRSLLFAQKQSRSR